MRKLPLYLAALATLAAPVAAAHADTYSFTISTDPSTFGSPAATFVASGTFSGTPSTSVSSALNLTAVTGSAQGYQFGSVIPVNSNNSFAYDDLLYTASGARYVDASGILLSLLSPAGTSLAHIYDSNGYHVDVFDPNDPADITPFNLATFTVTPSAVPEPSTLALFGTGALGLFGAARRRLHR